MKNLASTVLAFGMLSACSTAPPLELRFESAHYDYYSSEPVCEALPEAIEEAHGILTGYLDVEPPGRIEYRQETYAGGGCEGSGSCYKDGTIHSVFPLHPHEMVHAISASLGDPPFLFEEGLAEVLGCIGNSGWPTILEKPPISSLFESGAFASARDENLRGTYALAGSFVRFLLDELGEERFFELYSTLSFVASKADVATAVESAFGEGMSRVQAAWESRVESRDMQCSNALLCDAPVLANEVLQTPSCSLMVFGGNRRTFDLPEEGVLVRTIARSNSGFASIESCDGGTIGSGMMNMTTPSVVDSESNRLVTEWYVRARSGLYSWYSNFVDDEYTVEIVDADAPIVLGGENRAVLLGRFLDGTVSHALSAEVSGQLYATQVREGDSPPFDIEVCVDGVCKSVTLSGGQPSVDLGPVNAGTAFDVTVSSPTFNGAVGAALAIRPQ